MKHKRFSRVISMLLALTIVLSLLSGMTVFAATGTVSHNTASRHVVCTSLSSQAKAYYTGSNTYAKLSQLSGVSSPTDSWATTQNNDLYEALQSLMSSTHTVYSRYNPSGEQTDELSYLWDFTDSTGSSEQYIYFYADLLADDYGTTSMQREHVWPKSNASYYETNGGSDLHHLRPSIGGVNSAKSNNTFGNVASTGTAYQVNGMDVIWTGNSMLEVRDNVKGDVARILLYVYCRWGQPNLYTDVSSSKLPTMDSDDSTNNGTRAIDGMETLLEWMEIDPVDEWEMARNDQIENFQGNRNVFIDYPEFAWLVLGQEVPSDYTTPSGEASGGSSSGGSGTTYTVSASVNNPAYGSVNVSGYTITATPNTGYEVGGYTILSGTATVTQTGNTFTVAPTSDCSIRINFKTATYTVSASVNNSAYGSVSVSGYTITATPNDGYEVSGYNILSGTATVSQNGNVFTVSPTTDCSIRINFKARTSYTVTFSVPSGVSQSSLSAYAGESITLPTPTGTPTATAQNYRFLGWVTASVADSTTKPTVYTAGSSYTPTGNTTLYALYTYTAGGSGSTGYCLVTDESALYSGANVVIASASSNYAMSTTQNTNTRGHASITKDSSNNTISFTGSVCEFELTSGSQTGTWAFYDSTNSGYIYAASRITNAIRTQSTVNDNASFAITITNDNAVITAQGSNSRNTIGYGSSSFACYSSTTSNRGAVQLYIKTASGTAYYTTVLGDACSHSYNSVVTAPTCTESGYTTHTCALCGDVYVDSTIAALGHSYDSGTVTSAATCEASGIMTYACQNAGCGSSYTESIPATGHNYVDNVCANCGASRSDDRYVLTTSLSDGDQVIIVNVSYNKALSSTYTGFYCSGVDVTPTGGVITSPTEDIVWTVGIDEAGNYTFSTASGSKLSMDTSYTSTPLDMANDTWTLTAAPTTANAFYVGNAGRSGYYLEWYSSRGYWSAYNYTTTEALFATQFYTKVTESGEEHAHSYTTVVTAPTCTEGGYTTYICTTCGDTYTADETEALGHVDQDENSFCDVCIKPFIPGDWILSTTAPTAGNKYIIAAYEADTDTWYALSTDDVNASTSAGEVVHYYSDTLIDPINGVIFGAKERTYTSGSSSWTGIGFHEPENRYCLHLGNAYIRVTSGAANGVFSFTPGTAENTFIMKSDVNSRYLTFSDGKFGISSSAGTDLYFFYQPCDHDITYVTGVVDPTCSTVGSSGTTKCSWCSATIIVATQIPTLDHSYETVVTAPTCETAGYTTYTCSVCGDTYTGDEVAATGHSHAYTNNGDDHTVTCANCDYNVTEGHTYVDGTCVCGAVEVIVPPGPTEVEIKISHSVSFDSDLKMNYRIKLENIAAAIPTYVTEGAYLVVEKDRYPVSGGLLVETVTLYPDLTTDTTRILFNLGGIQSVEMGSELRAVLHIFDADGKEYVTPVDVYSVLAYAQLCFDTYTYVAQPEFYTMLIDVLNYGAAAQTYFGRRADELVNASMDAYQQYATTELSEELTDVRTYVDNDREITAVTAIGFSVTFDAKTEMNAKLTTGAGYTADDITSVKVLNEAGDVVDTLTDFTLLDDGRIQVTYYGVKSIQMRDMFYFVAYVGDQVASQHVGYSVEAFAKSSVASTNANLTDMALKCMYYGDAAYAYFNR